MSNSARRAALAALAVSIAGPVFAADVKVATTTTTSSSGSTTTTTVVVDPCTSPYYGFHSNCLYAYYYAAPYAHYAPYVGAAAYNPWTGTGAAARTASGYNAGTGNWAVGQQVGVANAYTGNYAGVERGAAYNENTGAKAAGVHGTAGNAYTGNEVNAGRGILYDPNTGDVTRAGGVQGENGGIGHVGSDVYVDRNGTVSQVDRTQRTRPQSTGTQRTMPQRSSGQRAMPQRSGGQRAGGGQRPRGRR
jgi:hypothetical protein